MATPFDDCKTGVASIQMTKTLRDLLELSSDRLTVLVADVCRGYVFIGSGGAG
jgi:hypothetical protein